MSRLLKIVAAMMAVVVVGCAGLGVVFRQRLSNGYELAAFVFEETESEVSDKAQFLDYLAGHPDTVSVVAYTVGEDGTAKPGTRIEHRADAPMVLASTVKIVVLAAYARAVEQGVVSPEDPVKSSEWDSWYLPGSDGGAHSSAYDRLGIAHSGGFATDPTHSVPLRDVVGAMIRESDNAATDTVISRVPDVLEALVDELGHGPVTPFLPAMADIADGQCGNPPETSTVEQRRALVDHLVLPGVRVQRDLLDCALQRGSAATYAEIQTQVALRQFDSPATSERMARFLEWPMENPSTKEKFAHFGTKGGAVAGVITEASYIEPLEGGFAGEKRIVVVFVNQARGMPWLTMISSFAHQQFMIELGTDPAFADEVKARLAR